MLSPVLPPLLPINITMSTIKCRYFLVFVKILNIQNKPKQKKIKLTKFFIEIIFNEGLI